MNDTLPEIETLYRETLMAQSGQERFRMGLEMFEVARVMMLAGLEDENGGVRPESRFRRLSANELSEDELHRILRRINASRGCRP